MALDVHCLGRLRGAQGVSLAGFANSFEKGEGSFVFFPLDFGFKYVAHLQQKLLLTFDQKLLHAGSVIRLCSEDSLK